MNKSLRNMICLVLALLTAVSCCAVTSFAADAGEVLEFSVSEDDFAIVSRCDENAQGIVAIPAKVTISSKTYAVKYIGEKAFDSCYGVTQISIPEGVTVIGNYAFRDCIYLSDVYIPRSLAICQYDAFDGCKNVTVHCYRSNYQFFTVFGISSNITVDILDASEEEPDSPDSTAQSGFFNTLFNAIRNLVMSILEYFKVNTDDDFEFEFPFTFTTAVSSAS